MFLCAGCEIGSAGCSFVVDDLAQRLIQDLVTGLPNFKRQIGVLVIGGRVARVEAAHAWQIALSESSSAAAEQ